jgi:hypothetical protein
MGKILLDYLFPITAITPAPAASTAFLKQVLVICARKDSGVTYGTIVECTSGTEVDAVAAAASAPEIKELFSAGMAKVYLLPSASLDVDDYIAAATVSFFTILVTSDFNDAAVTAADFGDFAGVVGVASTDNATFLPAQAAIENRCAFFMDGTTKAKNLFYAFGKLLSNASQWKSQQYVICPESNGVTTLGAAQALFDHGVSFVITDSEFSNRLSFFGAGGHAIVEPYIKQNIAVDMQSKALTYISANQPAYTKTQASLLEDELRHVIDNYENDGVIEKGGTVEVALGDDAFIATADISVPEPSSLWIIQGTLTET